MSTKQPVVIRDDAALKFLLRIGAMAPDDPRDSNKIEAALLRDATDIRAVRCRLIHGVNGQISDAIVHYQFDRETQGT